MTKKIDITDDIIQQIANDAVREAQRKKPRKWYPKCHIAKMEYSISSYPMALSLWITPLRVVSSRRG